MFGTIEVKFRVLSCLEYHSESGTSLICIGETRICEFMIDRGKTTTHMQESNDLS